MAFMSLPIPLAVSVTGASAPRPRENPHYDRLGGHDAVVRLVEAFYGAMEARPQARAIRAMHGADLAPVREVLVTYLAEWMGGPAAYTAARGTPKLRRRHQGFAIDGEAADAWMACMREALAATCADAALRAELDAAFSKLADFIRNTEPGGDARAHPGRPRETHPGTPGAAHTSSPNRSIP
jgi:hemoglobin